MKRRNSSRCTFDRIEEKMVEAEALFDEVCEVCIET
jgi:hypothetical protein